MLRLPFNYELVDSYLKVYPTFIKLIEYNQSSLRKIPDLDPGKTTDCKSYAEKQNKNDDSISKLDAHISSIYRTRTMIQDLCLSNNFELFVTFTFKHDRQNMDNTRTKMSNWLHNVQKRYGKIEYLIVSELHKDEKSIHFHALIKNSNFPLVPACKNTPRGQNYCPLKHKHKKIYKNGIQVFNIKSYTLGFSTATFIQSVEKTSSYIRKYITKDMLTFSNKKRYWRSKNLIKPYKITNPHKKNLNHIINNPYITFTPVYEHAYYSISTAKISLHQLTELSTYPSGKQ